TTLPLDLHDLCDSLKIIFVGCRPHQRNQLKNVLTVRKKKVFEALQWLRQNNALYRNVTINQSIISKLPDDDVPECLWATMEISTNVEAAENERASYIPDPLTNASEFNNRTAISIISSAVLDVNGTKVSSDEVAKHLLERIKAQVPEKTHGKDTEQNSKQDTVYIIPRGNKLANEYSNPNLLLGIFPTLFPYGCGGLEDGSRPIQINFHETNDGASTTSDDRTLIGQIESTASEVIPPCLPTPNPALEGKAIDKSDRHLLKNVTDPQGQQLPTEGTKMNERHTFDSVHPQSTSHLIIKRSIPVVPVLTGPQIPRREREETHERYCRALLTLFMPWRSVQNLCATNEIWSEALEARRLLISPNSLKIIENIELLHECKHDRDEHLHQVLLEAQNDNSIDPILMPNYYEGDENAEEDDPEQLLQMLSIVNEITTNTYSALAATQEQRYVHDALQAIDNTDRFALLNDSRHIWDQNNYGTIHDINTFVVAHAYHSVMIKGWKRDIEGRRDEARNYLISGENTLEVRDDETQIVVVATEIPTSPIKTRATRVPPVTTTNAILFPTKQDIIRQFTLSTQQKYAFMIITSHLDGENHAYTGI
ncbi:unnamed protein product, partial [Rotaria sp. Silwood1]